MSNTSRNYHCYVGGENQIGVNEGKFIESVPLISVGVNVGIVTSLFLR
jgi:hypothetical protein